MLQSTRNKATLNILGKLRKQGAPGAKNRPEMPMQNVDDEFQARSQLFPEEVPPGDASSDAAPISLNPEDDNSDPISRERKRRLQRRAQQGLGSPDGGDEEA